MKSGRTPSQSQMAARPPMMKRTDGQTTGKVQDWNTWAGGDGGRGGVRRVSVQTCSAAEKTVRLAWVREGRTGRIKAVERRKRGIWEWPVYRRRASDATAQRGRRKGERRGGQDGSGARNSARVAVLQCTAPCVHLCVRRRAQGRVPRERLVGVTHASRDQR